MDDDNRRGRTGPKKALSRVVTCLISLTVDHSLPFLVFTKNLCSQMSAISGPLLQWLEDRLEQNKQRMQELQREKEELLEELSAL